MTSIRVLPRRSPCVDAGLVAIETMVALVVAHLAVGGMLPSLSWIVVMATTVFVAGLLLLRGSVRSLVVAPCLVGTQLLLHCWLSVLPQVDHGHRALAGHAAMSSAPMAHLGLGVPMVLAHLGAGLFATWSLHVRRLAVRVFMTWADPGPRVPARPAPRSCRPSRTFRPAQRLRHTSPRRGPPRMALA